MTWSMDGNHNFIGKALGMFMDMMLGTDIEKGLAELKTVAEGKQVAMAAAAAAAPGGSAMSAEALRFFLGGDLAHEIVHASTRNE